MRAGEWDDNVNYREFQRYLTMTSDQPIHRVDVSNRHFLVVRDSDGRAVPRCPVTIADDTGRTVTLTTAASGRALLFPRAEGLRAATAIATASCEDGRAMARFNLDGDDAVVDLKLDTRRALPKHKTIDLAFLAASFLKSDSNKRRLIGATAAVLGVAGLDVVCSKRLVSQDWKNAQGNPKAPTNLGQSHGRRACSG